MLQWLQPHRRECFAKPEEVIRSRHSMLVSFLLIFLIHLVAFAARDQFKADNYGESEP